MAPPKVKVTSKQQTVLDGLKAGKSAKEIAKEMRISVNGVYGHIRRLRKLGALPKTRSRRGRSRASTSARSTRRNGRPRKMSEVTRAVKQAHGKAKARLVQISNEEDKLRHEREEIEEALTVR